jgi:hypothetical protein
MIESHQLEPIEHLLNSLPEPRASWPDLLAKANKGRVARRRLAIGSGLLTAAVAGTAVGAMATMGDNTRRPIQVVAPSPTCTGLTANVATQQPSAASSRGYAFVFLAASSACRPGNQVQLDVSDGNGDWRPVSTAEYSGPRLPIESKTSVEVGRPGTAQVWISWQSADSCSSDFALVIDSQKVPITLPHACADGMQISPLIATSEQQGWTPDDHLYPGPSSSATTSG